LFHRSLPEGGQGRILFMDKVALSIVMFVVIICALIVFARVYFGNSPWSL